MPLWTGGVWPARGWQARRLAVMTLPRMTQEASPPLDARRRRILFRATHRGTHENDILIGGFVAPRLSAMSDDELAAVEALMELPDPDLADWLSGRRPIPAERDSPLLRAMRQAAEARLPGDPS